VLGAMGILTGGRARFFSPQVDVFHSTDFKIVPMRCPVVATLWDAIPVAHPEWLSPRSRLMAPLAIRRVAHFANRVICATSHAADDIVRHLGVPRSRVSIVPWGIGEQWLTHVSQAEVDDVLARRGLTAGYVLSVGTIQPRKNVSTLIDAYEALPASIKADHKLVVVGRRGWSSEKVTRRLERLAAEGRAVWLEHVPSDREVQALYQGAGVFVLPSLYEGFGIPLLEAFASGVPVVTSNATSLPEVAGDAAITVNPLSVPQMSEGIRALLMDRAERATRIARGYARARGLTVANAAAATVEVYRETIKGP
jgi:alpha-1,3-rhamnosyl/mannosyltransferase